MIGFPLQQRKKRVEILGEPILESDLHLYKNRTYSRFNYQLPIMAVPKLAK
jgi:hypothetical protein